MDDIEETYHAVQTSRDKLFELLDFDVPAQYDAFLWLEIGLMRLSRVIECVRQAEPGGQAPR
jgi:hypothetical protein